MSKDFSAESILRTFLAAQRESKIVENSEAAFALMEQLDGRRERSSISEAVRVRVLSVLAAAGDAGAPDADNLIALLKLKEAYA